MRAMSDVFNFISARSTALGLRDWEQTIMRLLQQIIECCLFINKYSQKSFDGGINFLSAEIIFTFFFEERKLITGDGRKMSEFISFFVIFKDALESETGALPTFAPSRAARAIDESGTQEVFYLFQDQY